jgi:hypothetical protein
MNQQVFGRNGIVANVADVAAVRGRDCYKSCKCFKCYRCCGCGRGCIAKGLLTLAVHASCTCTCLHAATTAENATPLPGVHIP